MDRALKMMLAFIAALACLIGGCGGSGWLVEPLGEIEGLASVRISATAIYSVAGYEEPAPSKDAIAIGGAGYGGGELSDEALEIYESTGGLCDFTLGYFSVPEGILEIFDSRLGTNCADDATDPEQCLNCTVAYAAGSCRLDCTGLVPMDPRYAAESIEVTVDNISSFKAVEHSAMGALAIRTLVSDWPETDLAAAEQSKGISLTACSGGTDLMKADPADPESFEDLSSDEWLYILTVTDLGTDKDGDGLTLCIVNNWVKTTISFADVENSEDVHIGRGPIRFSSRACSEPSECPQ